MCKNAYLAPDLYCVLSWHLSSCSNILMFYVCIWYCLDSIYIYIYIRLSGTRKPGPPSAWAEFNWVFEKLCSVSISWLFAQSESMCTDRVIFLPEHSCSLWVFPKDPSWDLSFFFSCFLYFNLNNHLLLLLIMIFCSSSSFLLQDFVDGVWVLCVGDFLSGLRGTLGKKVSFHTIDIKIALAVFGLGGAGGTTKVWAPVEASLLFYQKKGS